MDHGMSFLSRRGLLASAAVLPGLALAAAPVAAAAETIDATIARTQAALRNAQGTKLVLLGTGGGPVPGQARHMTSHVMLHNGAAYVLDCGMGATRQFARTGIPFGAVRAIFITHHHPDHNIELGPFLVVGWVGGLRQTVRAYGPPPLTQMTQDLMSAYKATIGFWAEDFHRPPLAMIETHDLPEAGAVVEDDNVRVASVLVQHPPVKPAYGYRFDFPDRSIAFSGDTVPLDAVAQMAKGADILVHETMDLPAIEASLRRLLAQGAPGNLENMMAHMHADHATSEEVGRVAQEAGVKTLVLSHLVPGTFEVSDAGWRTPAAKHFKGRIIVGRDLMVI